MNEQKTTLTSLRNTEWRTIKMETEKNKSSINIHPKKTQKNKRIKWTNVCRSKISLWVNRDETINHIISKCNKLAQKEYKTRHDWGSKVIHWELCKKFKSDHTNKWYMHNPTSALENDTHKSLWDFDIQTNHLTSARRPEHIINCWIVDFAVLADYRVKLKESKKKNKCVNLTREGKKCGT